MIRNLLSCSGFGLVNGRRRAKDTAPTAGERDRRKTEESDPVCRHGIQHDAQLTEYQLTETRTARWGRRKRADRMTGNGACAA